jgi:quercetin dioxygenase-like cupin family protein
MNSKLKSMLQEVEQSSHPVAKALQKTELNKVLAIAFKKGMFLKEHKANLFTTIYLLEGKMKYQDAERDILMEQYGEVEILSNLPHAVEALEDSLLLLVQG